jgi:hypothetical protein
MDEDAIYFNAAPVTLKITDAEALVLFEFLFRLYETGRLEFAHPAEKQVLWNLYRLLEQVLDAPRWPDYRGALDLARFEVGNTIEYTEE